MKRYRLLGNYRGKVADVPPNHWMQLTWQSVTLLAKRRASKAPLCHAADPRRWAALLLERIKHWFSSILASRAEHEAAWSVVREPGPDGFSAHQRACERELKAVLELRGLSLQNRRVELIRLAAEDPEEALVYAEVPQLGAEIWISASQTDIDTPGESLRLEEWDCRTPTEHVQVVRDFVESLPSCAPRAAQQGVEPDVK